MKIIITEEQKKKLFIPRKLSKSDHRWMDHNNSQPVKDGVRINQYDENGLRQGYWEGYYDNGQLIYKGRYVDGKREGYWEFYWSNGSLNRKGNYINGKNDGYWEIYYENGKLHSKGNYINGEKDGYWESYWDNGQLSSKGNYIDGEKDGYWESYYKTGEFLKGMYKNGEYIEDINESEKKKLFIPRKLSKGDSRYDAHNNSQPVKGGVKINQYDEEGNRQGYWEEYYNNGKLSSKGSYVDGEKDGYWEEYYRNGELRSKGNYVDDEMEGYWEFYYDNGVLDFKGNYINGEKDGYWEFYHSNGQLVSKGNYVGGKKDGYWEEYFTDGGLMSKGNYVDGKEDGYWESYYLNGELKSKGMYKDDELVQDLTESEKKKLFIPRKLSKDNHRWMDHNNSQPVKDGVRINQYDENGLKQGYWEHYIDGILNWKGRYVNNNREGYWEEYWGNGQLYSKGNYKDGKADGYWEMYYMNGQLQSKGYFEKGVLINSLNESEKKKLFIPRKLTKGNSRYDEWNNKQPIVDGVRINQYDEEGNRQGYWVNYDNGRISSKGNYKDDKYEGYWEFYYYNNNGQLSSKGNYVNGKREGYWVDYHPNGKLEYKGYYDNGYLINSLNESEKKKLFIPRKLSKSDHRWMDHNKSQPIKDGVRINQYDEEGNRQGYWEEYYNDGRLWTKGSYVDNMRDGYWEKYYSNGQLLSKGNYKDDNKEGYWVYYNGKGELDCKGYYENGDLINSLNESEKKKLFIPRKLSKGDSRFDAHNNSQLVKDGVKINQYDEEGRKQGYWEYYYDNGKLLYKGNMKNGKKEGYWEWYYPNGKLSSKGNYVNGEKDGYWESYYMTGQLMSKGYYENGDLINSLNESEKKKLFIPRKLSKGDNRYDEWNKSQPVKDGMRINQYDYDGLKQGYWEVYHDNGQLYSKGNYKDGKADGYWEVFYNNGMIALQGAYKNGKEDGYWVAYNQKGETQFSGMYKNGKLVSGLNESEKKKLFIPRKLSKDDSRYDEWNNSQPIKDGVRINQYDEEGRKQGYWEDYWDNGQLESKGSYVDGEKEGYWEEYYYGNGQLLSKGNYVNGVEEGYWEEYWNNGQLMYKGYYKNGKKVKNLTESEKKKLFIPRKLDERFYMLLKTMITTDYSIGKYLERRDMYAKIKKEIDPYVIELPKNELITFVKANPFWVDDIKKVEFLLRKLTFKENSDIINNHIGLELSRGSFFFVNKIFSYYDRKIKMGINAYRNDIFVFIADESFNKGKDGRYDYDLSIERLIKVSAKNWRDISDYHKTMDMPYMQLRAQSNNKTLYKIIVNKGLLDEYDGVSGDEIPRSIRMAIDEKKERI